MTIKVDQDLTVACGLSFGDLLDGVQPCAPFA
jgi:hypothetical protein